MNSTSARAQDEPSGEIDPFLMSVLSSRFEAIIREMTNTVVKASRSAVIKNARDLSCSLLTYDHRLISTEEGLPIHVTALDLTTKPISEFFDDIKQGDAFINNCPYTGVTHHADITICVPVFCDGEPMFWSLARSHHADVGAPIPTTYLPYARTIYEEGMHFPCVRIQQNYEDIADIIRMGMMKIRVNHIWYGDYQAQVGACRIGERRLNELVERYGKDTIKAFIAAWMAYGERRAIAAIREFPAGTYDYETVHDPIPSVVEDGVRIRVRMTVDPEEGLITVDIRHNDDNVDGGINLSECTATGSCRIGCFNNLDATIPHNEGSASRIRVLLREGSVVGKPKYPVGTACATTNVNDRLISAVNCIFSQMGEPFGQGESAYALQSGMAVISGVDTRKGAQPYVNQMFIGFGGGGANFGHDGWVTYPNQASGGMVTLDSVEIDESMYPIIVRSRHLACDTLGCGEWDGAPGMVGEYGPIADDMTAIYCSDGSTYAPRGVLGGSDSTPTVNSKRMRNGELVQLPDFHEEVCAPGETIHFCVSGGGGYGAPVKRDPQRVVATVNRGWLSKERTEMIYRVALRRANNGVDYEVDEEATRVLRSAAPSAGTSKPKAAPRMTYADQKN